MEPTRSFSSNAARARAGSTDAWSGLPGRLATTVHELASDGAVSDAELVRQSIDGSHDAFAALVARYQKRAFWIAFHVVGRVEDARDISQEAFVRLYRSLERYDYTRSFYTWFYRIVMNLGIDQLRKHKSARASSLDDLLVPLADEREGEATAPMEREEENEHVWQVLDKLDSKFRAVLVMRDIHGLSCREIAPILKVTHATARWRLHRGRQMFRTHWDRRFGEEQQ
ncbi:MAG: RNA polymerase sigma-70 factor (ECF subfamily) [Planctomycetota bacterium]|jgi:RNA polymerase sigma-70 factor (ECF subfamily)